jgi:PBP1b-binding outer membrane lipoprotein LpoB
MKMKKIIIPLLTIIYFANSCGNSATDEKAHPITEIQDIVKVDSNKIKKVDSTHTPSIDTIKKIPIAIIKKEIPKKKSAILGYSYFTHMKQNETRSIYAQVQALNDAKQVNKLTEDILLSLKEVNSQIKAERKSDTNT